MIRRPPRSTLFPYTTRWYTGHVPMRRGMDALVQGVCTNAALRRLIGTRGVYRCGAVWTRWYHGMTSCGIRCPRRTEPLTYRSTRSPERPPTKNQAEVSMKPVYRHVLPVVLLLLAASSLLAQGTTTGNILGTVTSDGKALPGATVTITSPALQGVRTAVSGEAGGYTFPSPPPRAYTAG